MKDTMRQLTVLLTIAGTILVNTLANTLPINGQNTGEISDRFAVYFTPAGYVFSIWGLIYLGLIVFGVFQALPSQRQNPRLRSTGWWVVVGNIANAAWIFLWHFEQFPLTILVMLVLLGSLVVTYLRFGFGKTSATLGEKLTVRLPFSIYLGWITVATVANATALLDYLKWNGFGIAAETWMGIVLAAVLTIAVLMNFTRRDIAYSAVVLWALAGIAIKHAAVPAVAIPTWVVFGLVAVTLGAAFLLKLPSQRIAASAN